MSTVERSEWPVMLHLNFMHLAGTQNGLQNCKSANSRAEFDKMSVP